MATAKKKPAAQKPARPAKNSPNAPNRGKKQGSKSIEDVPREPGPGLSELEAVPASTKNWKVHNTRGMSPEQIADLVQAETAGKQSAATVKVTTNARARGRKPRITYSPELLATILDRVARGEPLSRVCDSDDMPNRKSFFEWVAKDESIRRQYELAIEMRADLYAEETIAIADEECTYVKHGDGDAETEVEVAFDATAVARNRLRVDARKWYASKLAPKKYGDKLAVGGADDISPLTVVIRKFGE